MPKCKQCCCVSHHKLAEHKLRKGKTPALACDLAEVRLTYKEQEAGFKAENEFDSVNQMIWSCELNLNK